MYYEIKFATGITSLHQCFMHTSYKHYKYDAEGIISWCKRIISHVIVCKWFHVWYIFLSALCCQSDTNITTFDRE
jgi:hypothetical protein